MRQTKIDGFFKATSRTSAKKTKHYPFKGKKSFTSKVKEVVRRSIETPKHYVRNEIGTTLTEGYYYTNNICGGITQGDDNSSRDGDIIHLDAIKVRLNTQNDTDSMNSLFRLLLVRSNAAIGTTGAWTSGGLGAADLFINSPADPVDHGIIDPKRCTVLYDRVFNLQPHVASQVINLPHVFTKRLNQKFVYDTGTVYAKDKNLYWVVMGHQVNSTPGLSTVGSVSISYDLIFKNTQ